MAAKAMTAAAALAMAVPPVVVTTMLIRMMMRRRMVTQVKMQEMSPRAVMVVAGTQPLGWQWQCMVTPHTMMTQMVGSRSRLTAWEAVVVMGLLTMIAMSAMGTSRQMQLLLSRRMTHVIPVMI
jgi:hypothetical protein